MKTVNEKKYNASIKFIAEHLVSIADEDSKDDTAWRPDFEEVLDDYTGDFMEELKQAIKEAADRRSK